MLVCVFLLIFAIQCANIALMLDVLLYLLNVNRAALLCTDSILLTPPAM